MDLINLIASHLCLLTLDVFPYLCFPLCLLSRVLGHTVCVCVCGVLARKFGGQTLCLSVCLPVCLSLSALASLFLSSSSAAALVVVVFFKCSSSLD